MNPVEQMMKDVDPQLVELVRGKMREAEHSPEPTAFLLAGLLHAILTDDEDCVHLKDGVVPDADGLTLNHQCVVCAAMTLSKTMDIVGLISMAEIMNEQPVDDRPMPGNYL